MFKICSLVNCNYGFQLRSFISILVEGAISEKTERIMRVFGGDIGDSRSMLEVISGVSSDADAGPHHLAIRSFLSGEGEFKRWIAPFVEKGWTVIETENNGKREGYLPFKHGKLAGLSLYRVELRPPKGLALKVPYIFASAMFYDEVCKVKPDLVPVLNSLKPFLSVDSSAKCIKEWAQDHSLKDGYPVLPLSKIDYEMLQEQNPYLAWTVINVLAVGIRQACNNEEPRLYATNHYAYSVNKSEDGIFDPKHNYNNCEDVVAALKESGIEINKAFQSDVQRSPSLLGFEQCSTKSEAFSVIFSDQELPVQVPGEYVEFVKHPFGFEDCLIFDNAQHLFSSSDEAQSNNG